MKHEDIIHEIILLKANLETISKKIDELDRETKERASRLSKLEKDTIRECEMANYRTTTECNLKNEKNHAQIKKELLLLERDISKLSNDYESIEHKLDNLELDVARFHEKYEAIYDKNDNSQAKIIAIISIVVAIFSILVPIAFHNL